MSVTHIWWRGVHAGDIGEDQREYQVEPLTAPSVPEPVRIPQPQAPTPDREPVPA